MPNAKITCRLVLTIAVPLLAAFVKAAPAQDPWNAEAGTTDTVQALQDRIAADPQMMSAVQALRNNPQVQDILGDPDIAAALSRGDLTALLANPKIKRLAEDPAVQDVTRQVNE